MKLTTFIMAYKIALHNIGSKVASWKSVYVGSIYFPEENEDRLAFIFSTGHDMQAGEMALSVSLKKSSLSNLKTDNGGLNNIADMNGINNALDSDLLAREYKSHGEKINEAGRFIVLLEILLNRLQAAYPDSWEDMEVNEIYFDFNKDLAEFCMGGKSRIYTDGQLVLFGD